MDTPQNNEAAALEVVPQAEVIRAAEPDPMVLIEARNKAMERLLEYAIRSTSPEQWCDQDGKPYLMAGGAEAVARRCGVKFTDVSYTREIHTDELGSYYEFIFTGTVSLPGSYDRIEGITGSCMSRDAFIGTGTKRSLSDVDPGDIRKKAQTNMIQRGVTQLLGLRNLEWSTLARFGVTPDGASKIEYKTGNKGGGHSTSSEFTFGFGKSKGKAPSEVDEKDLAWYAGAFKSSLNDPEKAKFKSANEKGLAAVEAELARRANEKAGVGAGSGAGPAVSIWQRIQTLAADNEVPQAEVGPIVKKATGKNSSSQLVEEDFPKISKAILAAAEANRGDINF